MESKNATDWALFEDQGEKTKARLEQMLVKGWQLCSTIATEYVIDLSRIGEGLIRVVPVVLVVMKA